MGQKGKAGRKIGYVRLAFQTQTEMLPGSLSRQQIAETAFEPGAALINYADSVAQTLHIVQQVSA
jgi:hypothetical protein